MIKRYMVMKICCVIPLCCNFFFTQHLCYIRQILFLGYTTSFSHFTTSLSLHNTTSLITNYTVSLMTQHLWLYGHDSQENTIFPDNCLVVRWFVLLSFLVHILITDLISKSVILFRWPKGWTRQCNWVYFAVVQCEVPLNGCHHTFELDATHNTWLYLVCAKCLRRFFSNWYIFVMFDSNCYLNIVAVKYLDNSMVVKIGLEPTQHFLVWKKSGWAGSSRFFYEIVFHQIWNWTLIGPDWHAPQIGYRLDCMAQPKKL